MGNADKNRQFKNVCRQLGIIEPSQKTNFHRYLGKYYRKESNNFSFQELIKVGREFLEIEEGKKGQIKDSNCLYTYLLNI